MPTVIPIFRAPCSSSLKGIRNTLSRAAPTDARVRFQLFINSRPTSHTGLRCGLERRSWIYYSYFEPFEMGPGPTFTETPVLIFGDMTIGLIAGFTDTWIGFTLIG